MPSCAVAPTATHTPPGEQATAFKVAAPSPVGMLSFIAAAHTPALWPAYMGTFWLEVSW